MARNRKRKISDEYLTNPRAYLLKQLETYLQGNNPTARRLAKIIEKLKSPHISSQKEALSEFKAFFYTPEEEGGWGWVLPPFLNHSRAKVALRRLYVKAKLHPPSFERERPIQEGVYAPWLYVIPPSMEMRFQDQAKRTSPRNAPRYKRLGAS